MVQLSLRASAGPSPTRPACPALPCPPPLAAKRTQDTLSALGVDVDLGIANVEITEALVQYATADVTTAGGIFIRQGMRVKGDLNLFGLHAIVDFALNSDGVRLNATLDFTAVSLACRTYVRTYVRGCRQA